VKEGRQLRETDPELGDFCDDAACRLWRFSFPIKEGGQRVCYLGRCCQYACDSGNDGQRIHHGEITRDQLILNDTERCQQAIHTVVTIVKANGERRLVRSASSFQTTALLYSTSSLVTKTDSEHSRTKTKVGL